MKKYYYIAVSNDFYPVMFLAKGRTALVQGPEPPTSGEPEAPNVLLRQDREAHPDGKS